MSSTSVFTFDHSLIFDASLKKWIEVLSSDHKLYCLLTRYIASHAKNAQCFSTEVLNARSSNSNSGNDSSVYGRVGLHIGLGIFSVEDFEGNSILAVHQSKGEPLINDCGITQLFSLVLVVDKSLIEKLAFFLSRLVEESEETAVGLIHLFFFNARQRYWRSSGHIPARPLASVILPDASLEKVKSDIDRFLGVQTKSFYEKHGIPYRRCYLFYGVPGSGKTSLIQAIAGYCCRSLSFLQVDPEMTDSALKAAMEASITRVGITRRQNLPSDTVVVIEDIDAIFASPTKARRSGKAESANEKPISLSGLLNALDGVGSASGQICILTTNFRENLDPALIRKGRVDLQVHFDYATDEQVERMWGAFYPSSAALAPEYRRAVRAALAGRPVTTASLQHFFVMEMEASADEALAAAGDVAEEVDQQEEPGADEARADTADKTAANASFKSLTRMAKTGGKGEAEAETPLPSEIEE